MGDDTQDGLTDAEKQSMCERCGGCCCSFRGLNISFGAYTDDGGIREFLLKEFEGEDTDEQMGHQLLRKSGDVPDMEWVDDGKEILFECNHLTDDGRCGIYDDRPEMCRSFECAALRGEMDLKDFLATHARDPGAIDMDALDDVTDEVNAALEELEPLAE